jgi:hypothetical protein
MKRVFAMLALAIFIAGCTTKYRAQMEAQQAFLEGQNATLKQQVGNAGVTLIGAVENSLVPWVAGLTLAQAVATANFIGADEPQQIILTRHGESATLEAKVLLDGTIIPLEPGDVVELR